MKRILYVVTLVVSVAAVFGCSKKDSSPSSSQSGGSGEGSVILLSTVIGGGSTARVTLPGALTSSPTNCHLSFGGPSDGSADGQCFTPTRVGGTATILTVNSRYMGVVGKRLMGGGSSGVDGLFNFGKFDFKTGPAFKGENNLEEIQETFDRITVSFNHLDVQFEAASKVWNLRYLFYTQPVLNDSTFSDCFGSHSDAQVINGKGSIFADMEIQRGDILVCLKDSTEETCADSDYNWVDSGTSTLTSTRPTTPVRLTGTYLTSTAKCTRTGEGPFDQFNLPAFDFHLAVSNPFSLMGKTTEGKRSYTYQSGCTAQTTNCTGTPVSGETLTTTIDFDLSNAMFVEQSLNIATATQTQILQNLDKVMLKPLYIQNNLTHEVNDPALEISATVSVDLK